MNFLKELSVTATNRGEKNRTIPLRGGDPKPLTYAEALVDDNLIKDEYEREE
jgi:hypothetical protein